jgi:hypothetical protein
MHKESQQQHFIFLYFDLINLHRLRIWQAVIRPALSCLWKVLCTSHLYLKHGWDLSQTLQGRKSEDDLGISQKPFHFVPISSGCGHFDPGAHCCRFESRLCHPCFCVFVMTSACTMYCHSHTLRDLQCQSPLQAFSSCLHGLGSCNVWAVFKILFPASPEFSQF